MNNLYKNNRFKILAVFIALLLWFYVNNQTDNFWSILNRGNNLYQMEIEMKNLSDEYKIKDSSERNVDILVDKKDFFSTYTRADFKAYIILDDVRPGENIKKVIIDSPVNVKILDIEPEYIKITIDEKRGG